MPGRFAGQGEAASAPIYELAAAHGMTMPAPSRGSGGINTGYENQGFPYIKFIIN